MISRAFKATPAALWTAWTQPAEIRKWWGPRGSAVEHCDVALVPGGMRHEHLVAPDGREMWSRSIYREIVAPERLVFVQSFSDSRGGIVRHPGNPNWPLEMLTTVRFREGEGETILAVEWLPLNPTEAERQAFDAGRELMRMGWSGTFDRLGEYVGLGKMPTSGQ